MLRKFNMRFSLVIWLFFNLLSCNESGTYTRLCDGFTVGYTDLPRHRNVYYNSQGIFVKKTVLGVSCRNKFIFVCTVNLDDEDHGDGQFRYFIIDIATYKKNPEQENSAGLLGPYDEQEMDIMLKKLQVEHKSFDRSWNY